MTTNDNPWVSQPTLPAPTPAREALPALPPSGPTRPQTGVPAPDRVDQLAIATHPSPAPLWLLGAHGGAGESTLATVFPKWAPAGHRWPVVQGITSNVVVLARTNATGLRAAQNTARQWAAGLVPGCHLIGLVLLPDAPGKLPKPLREQIQLVSGAFPHVWTAPWIEQWRMSPPGTPTEAPRSLHKIANELNSLINTDGTSATNERNTS